MKRSLFTWIAGAAAVAIVITSILVRFTGPADPTADVGAQREAVTRFHGLVRAGRWTDVYASMTEPPARDAGSFAELMREQVAESGKVTRVRIDDMRLLRSRTTPLLEVHETLTLSTRTRTRTVSYYARRGDRWLFAFSAPANANDEP